MEKFCADFCAICTTLLFGKNVKKNKIRKKNDIKPNTQDFLYIMHKISIKMIKNFCHFDE